MNKIKLLALSCLLCSGCVSVGVGASFPIGGVNLGVGASKPIFTKKAEKKEQPKEVTKLVDNKEIQKKN